MLPTDPGDGPGGVAPAQPLSDIVPLQAMPRGGTIIRPGAVAWGGTRDVSSHVSCEAIERALAAAIADPDDLPALLTELAAARVWVPLPAVRRPFTDGTAVRLPLIGHQGTDFVPCFTSVLRLNAWACADESGQRAGDPRAGPLAVVPHIVVPAAGLAGRLPAGVGLAVNPDSVPGVPLYPECMPHLAELGVSGRADPRVVEDWVLCNTRRLYTCD